MLCVTLLNVLSFALECRKSTKKISIKTTISGGKIRMSKYIYNWKDIEGINLTKTAIRNILVDSLEKEHLLQISSMLSEEGFNPIDFTLCEYPSEGVYCIEKIGKKRGVDYFVIEEQKGKLTPTYTTLKSVDGFNDFPCNSIKESIEKMEC